MAPPAFSGRNQLNQASECSHTSRRHRAARLATQALLPFAAGAVNLFASCKGKIPRWVGDLEDEELKNLLSFQQGSS
jgi:hypothetical protein